MATPLLLPRGIVPPDYGERLRQAGLNNGVSFGGSEIDIPEGLSPEQQAQYMALAQPAAGGGISNADIARFLAQQNGGTLPGLPSGGGGEPATPADMPEGPTGPPSLTLSNGPTGNISEGPTVAGSYSGAGRSDVQQAIDSAISALNGPTGQNTLNSIGALGAVPGVGAIPSLLSTAGRLTGSIGRSLGFGTEQNQDPTVDSLNTALGGSLRGTTPEAQAALAAQRSGERSPTPFATNRDENAADPNADAAAAAAANAATAAATTEGISEGTSSGGVSGSTGSEGGASGTGGGPSGDSGGGSGAPGDGPYRRGGLVAGRSRPVSGSFKGAKKFSSGGAVPMTRAQRVKSFEDKYGNVAV